MPALLFDLDGTLADTKPDLHAAMNHVLTKNNLAEVPDDAITNMIGGGAREILKRGLSENGTSWDDAKLDAATEEFVLWYDQNIDANTTIYPNLLPLLNAAQAANIKMAVVTNKRESLSAKLLFRLGLHHYFDVLVGGDTLPKRKPDPDTIELALQRSACRRKTRLWSVTARPIRAVPLPPMSPQFVSASAIAASVWKRLTPMRLLMIMQNLPRPPKS